MAIVHHHSLPSEVDQVEPPWRLEEAAAEGSQRLPDVIQLNVIRDRRGSRGERVGDVDPRPSFECGRNLARQHQRCLPPVLDHRDHLAGRRLAQQHGLALLPDVILNHRVAFVHAEVDDLPARAPFHLDDPLVVGVQNACAISQRALWDNGLHSRQFRQRVHAAQTEMVAGDVGDDGDVATVVAKTRAQDATSRRLEHGIVNRGVFEHHPGAARTAHVPREDLGAVDIDAVRGGESDPVSRRLHDVRNHARGRRLAIGPRHRNDRHPRGLAPREQHVDNRPPDVARVALGGVSMHAEARPGVDLADRPTAGADTLGNVGRDEIDAGDVQPHHHCRLTGDLHVVRMNFVGTVDRRAAGTHVSGQLELDESAFLGNVIEGPVVPLQHFHCLRVDRDPGQNLFMTDATPRIAVLDLDQFADRVFAIAGDVRGHAL